MLQQALRAVIPWAVSLSGAGGRSSPAASATALARPVGRIVPPGEQVPKPVTDAVGGLGEAGLAAVLVDGGVAAADQVGELIQRHELARAGLGELGRDREAAFTGC